jgi:hypothetical protein
VNHELFQRVYDRDLEQFLLRMGRRPTSVLCVAVFLDPTSSVTCSGRSTYEHVTPDYGRTGKKAKDREQEGCILCEGHHLMSYAGYIWATANKDLTRTYLKELYPEENHG